LAQALDITAAVVTEEVLRSSHAGESEIRVPAAAVVTPSAWDYVRYHRLQLIRGSRRAAVGSSSAATAEAITEVLPPGSDAGVLSKGRCDHPDRSYGCRTEEFGSGFVEPACCSDCASKQALDARAGNCGSCTTDDAEMETLVQQLTDEIMKRLGG
jgi:hypothetical protein